MNFYISICWNK